MKEFENLSISSAIDGLTNKKFTSLELTEFFIKRIENSKDLNCFITYTFDKAIEMAKVSDIKIKEKETRILEGIPIGMKDLFCTNGVRTTAGSKILENFWQAGKVAV